MRPAALIIVGVCLAGCTGEQDTALPPPITLTEEAAGHYCQMTVLDHPGPKAQVHLAGVDHPLWFAQVRDALAFDRMPEESAEVVAIYVNDMAKAASWQDPGVDNWIEVSSAVFVHGSRRPGGMGAPELVPFSTVAAAEAFADQFGGTVIPFDAVADDMVLAPIEIEVAPPLPTDAETSEVQG